MMEGARSPRSRPDRASPISATLSAILAALWSWRLVAGAAFAVPVAAAALPSPNALTANDPGLRTAKDAIGEFAIRDVNGVAGKLMPLTISIPATRSFEYTLLLFRGLPDGVTLSAGFRFQDAWAVSLKDADRLALLAAPGFEGRFVMEVALVKGAAVSPDKQSVAVRIARDDAAAPSNPNTATGLQALEKRDRAATPAPAPGFTAQEEETLVGRADALLRDGDIAAARLLYEHLAKRGSARAAIAAAQTYDPLYLQSLPVFGVRPDSEKARQWYKRALELGAQDAASRLSALDKGRH